MNEIAVKPYFLPRAFCIILTLISMITLNGKSCEGAGVTLEKLLETNGFQKSRVAVGLNGQVASKDELPNIILKDGDVIEVFHFMGGG